ncbi:class I SAM-dependent methyltransferase [Baekduia sp.]|jgi:SAM-dependent methyltransferase|uniref:class I SAM-dependent methyltransferase n=1 Tax=Baekduia sp. TaxID=2600305 RepID=UPI002E069C61|nr:class I SAM-dependent methyltransferase [Baekduia sp.]
MTLIQATTQPEKETSTAPYDALAPHYEAFVGGDRYGEWLAGLLGLAAQHGVGGGRALDVGCGTGRSLAALVAAGFTTEGCDPSGAMLREARAALGPDVALEVAALPHLPDRAPVDLVTAMNDVINCVAPDDLDAAVAALASRVRRGGLVLFDANTRRTYDGFFGSTFCRSDDDRFFVWESLPGASASRFTHRADLHAFARDPEQPDRWIRSVSHHVQHHHPHAQVTNALDAAGLELLLVCGQRDDGPRDDACDEAVHTKRIYLARLR